MDQENEEPREDLIMDKTDLLQTLLDLEKIKDETAIKELIADPENAGPVLDYYIAHLYYIGYIYDKDMEKCLQHLRASSLKNYASACFMMATMYERGDGVDVDLKIANEYLIKAAEQGYLPAVNHLGEMHNIGRLDIEQNPERAFELFRQCSIEGYAKGKINYAYCLVYKVGNDGDYQKGFQILTELAEQGYPEAMYNLGKVYYDGYGTKKDIIRALYWLLQATDNNHLFAAKMLGDCYYDGIGVAINHKLAFQYYKKAADLGNNEAAHLAANCLIAGDGCRMNFREAINYCVMAAHGGDASAQISLGNRYYFGDGLRRNYERAVYWYQEAAKQDDPVGLKNAADMFLVGNGCKKDVNKAIQYYKRAVELNYFAAAAPLAEIYATGASSIRKDYEEAVKYYQIAYEDDEDEYAAAKLADLVAAGKGVPYPDYTRAAKAYEFAANKGMLYAIKKAGEHYLKGIGVNRDYERALRFYLEASKMGDDEATILINVIRRSMEFSSNQ